MKEKDIEGNTRSIQGPTHQQTKSLQRKMLLISLVNYIICLGFLYQLYQETSRVASKWVDESIAAQYMEEVAI